MDRSAEEPLVPLSSDECGQSGVDSDEDVITDYLPLADPRALSPAETDVDAITMAHHHQRGSIGNATVNAMAGGPLVPTISVTPHSPAIIFSEDSLQQLHEIHDSIQAMRELPCAASIVYGIGGGGSLRLSSAARLSASCPSLNEAANGGIHGCSDPMLDSQGSVGSSPLHMPGSRKSSETQDWLLCRGLQGDTQRRRSWTALEDLSGTKEKVKQNRQRSMSLSSMESEADESSLLDNVDGSTARLLCTDPAITRRGRSSSGGGASTHSLNEADLQNDFNKLKAKREAEQRLLSARLPLQKSVSTPSIIAVRDIAPEPLVGVPPTLPIAPYDHHSEKRRKRGSLFFRKKKDKSKKVTHQWVSACYGASHICDWCSKPLSNKPALYCENCTTTVHQNSCKDNIVDCNKPKLAKNSAKLSGFSVSIPNSKSSLSKRGSSSTASQNSSSNSQIINEDKEIDHHSHHDSTSFPDDVPIVPLEFLTDTPLTAADLGSDPSLGLHESEPDSWTPAVGKEISRKLKEKEVKRQEHIYEFILTEKHHCLTLLTMQKVFVEGLQKYFQLGPNLERMFPRLVDLTALHLGLLSRLRERQRESPIVSSIADILLEQFSSHHAVRLKSAYGEFCSRHRDAVDIYKYYLQHDARFGQFVRHCQSIPLLKKKGIAECILFVTQRLTKYPLLIEPLIKTSKDNKEEQEMLQRALALVKEILVEVDAQVAEKEKEDRKLEIYNRIDAKSYTTHRGNKFKKSDILQGNRSLKFEGVAMLMQGRGKMQVVLVIVLSDVLFFLQENSHKYSFFTPDNKAGVVSLQKLLVREKAGQESRGIYLISSNPADPEMFELKVHKPKDKQVWIQAIRSAVQSCPEDEEDNIALSSEEKQKLLNAKQAQVRHLVGMLRQKDEEQAILLEEKMALQLRLLAAAGLDPPSPPPTYRHLVSEHADTGIMWKEVLSAVQEVTQLASSLYASGTNLSRSVSSVGEHQSETYVSPTLPKRAETFGGFDNTVSGVPLKILNKKLQASTGSQAGSPDTENLKPGDSKLFERLPWRNAVLATVPPGLLNGGSSNQNTELSAPLQHLQDVPTLLTLGREQQVAAVQLSHYVYTLLCIISQLMTSVDSLQSQLAVYKTHGAGSGLGGSDMSGDGRKPHYRPNQQLEELRNLQDKLSAEKASWQQLKDQEQRDLDEKKQELLRLQEQIRAEQTDITQQREQLYRKMEMLTSQGFLISPNVALPVGVSTQSHDEISPPEEALSSPSLSSPQTSEHSPTTTITSSSNHSQMGTEPRRKTETKWAKGTSKSSLPLNLISATNQPKAQNIPIKQQLPLKLASRLSSSGGSSTPSPNSTGTTPTGVQSSQPVPQQMLPLRLQEEKTRRSSGGSNSGGYQRLGSGNFSPPNSEASVPIASHSRTGSSPAMMQASPPGMPPQLPIIGVPSTGSGGAKAARTHTYPKLPDKFRVRSPEQPPPDEEVIFF